MPLVNQNIKILRKRLGLTQEKFAEKLGIKRSLLGAYEENRAIPPAENLKKISDVFDISLDHLLNQSFEKNTIGLPETKAAEIHVFQNEMQQSFGLQTKMMQADLFENAKSNANFGNENQQIRYVSKTVSEKYINEFSNIDFLQVLPVFNLPYLPKGYLRAFDAPNDFVLPESILICEKVANFDFIKNGENHLIVSKMGMKYRRVFSQIQYKNNLLLSSDKENVQSEELDMHLVVEIWLVKSYICKSLPLPNKNFKIIQNKIDDLKSQMDLLMDGQSKP